MEIIDMSDRHQSSLMKMAGANILGQSASNLKKSSIIDYGIYDSNKHKPSDKKDLFGSLTINHMLATEA